MLTAAHLRLPSAPWRELETKSPEPSSPERAAPLNLGAGGGRLLGTGLIEQTLVLVDPHVAQ